MEFTVGLEDRQGRAVIVPQGLRLSATWHRWHAEGGPAQAEIALEGTPDSLKGALGWIGHRVTVRNEKGTEVWWGRVVEATVRTGAFEYGASLAEMRNRIRVAYTYTDGDGVQQRGDTEWAENAASIAAYGVQELVHSMGDASQAQAVGKRDQLLAVLGLPAAVARVAYGEEAGGSLRCEGEWLTLDAIYYANVAGRLVFEGEGPAEQLIGWGLTAAGQIGFDPRAGRVCDIQARLGNLRAGSRLVVSGSAGNNGVFSVSKEADLLPPDDAPVSLTGTSFSFEISDDILHGAEQMDRLADGEMIQVSGSAGNNRFWFIRTAGADHLVVRPGDVVNESAGAAVTIVQGNSVTVTPAPVLERPAGGVTVTLREGGQKIAQRFRLVENASWTAAEALVRLRRIGSPGDSVRLEICADGGGAPGAVLETATLAGSSLRRRMEWVTFWLANTTMLQYGTYYWLVLSRTGSPSAENCYAVDVDEALGFADGMLRLWDGSAWVTREPDADLIFQIWGAEEAAEQIAAIVAAAGDFDGVENLAGATPESRQYRDGERSALEEIRDLLAAGTADGRRLLAEVTADRRVVVRAAPGASTVEWLLDREGKLQRMLGGAVEPGVVPVGQWVRIEDAPDQIDALTPFSPVFLEGGEVQAADGRLTPETAGMVSPWQVNRVRQG